MNLCEFRNLNLNVVFYKPRVFSIQTEEQKRKIGKENILTSWECFSNIECMNFNFENNFCNELMGIERLEPQCCILQTPSIFH